MDKDIMTPEEFFSEAETRGTSPARTCLASGGKKSQDVFFEAKVKMVMRVFGVSRTKALEIISSRAEEESGENGKDGGRQEEEALMSAADFFGE